MITFTEANQVRMALKMKLSQYAWYNWSMVVHNNVDGYSILLNVKKINNSIRKIISPIINGVSIKTQV